MSVVENERRKLTANWLNAIASGMIVTGAVAPLVAVAIGVAQPALLPTVLVSTSIWTSIAFGLHLIARRLLGRLLP
jgi:hypothetical protein